MEFKLFALKLVDLTSKMFPNYDYVKLLFKIHLKTVFSQPLKHSLTIIEKLNISEWKP